MLAKNENLERKSHFLHDSSVPEFFKVHYFRITFPKLTFETGKVHAIKPWKIPFIYQASLRLLAIGLTTANKAKNYSD